MKFRNINSLKEKNSLLNQMIDYGRIPNYLNANEMTQTHVNLLCRLPVNWVVADWNLSLTKTKDYSKKWQRKYGKWEHSGSHSELGMAYAWWAKEATGKLDDIRLQDRPDFRGKLDNKTVLGDIGLIAPVTLMFEALFSLSTHDLWISVSNFRQIILEFQYNIGSLIGLLISTDFKKEKRLKQNIKRIFSCDECGYEIPNSDLSILCEWLNQKNAIQS